MTETTIHDHETTILVEFEPRAGVRQVSRIGDLTQEQLAKLAESSEFALDRAMVTIRAMGRRITDTVKQINVADRPNEVSVEFGLKLDAKAGAYLAKAGAEAGFKVTLAWKHEEATPAEPKTGD